MTQDIDTTRNEFPERRRYPRYECHIVDRENQKISNISGGGVRLESNRIYNIGQEVDLSFSINGHHNLTSKAIVIRTSEGLGYRKYKYGLLYSNITDESRAALSEELKAFESEKHASLLSKQIFHRLPRVDVSKDPAFEVRFSLTDDTVKKAAVMNYSEFGIRIALPQPLPGLRPGVFLSNCAISFEGYEVFTGTAEVRNIGSENTQVEYGLSLVDGFIQDTRIQTIRLLNDLKQKFDDALASFESRGHFVEDFQLIVNELRLYLQNVKNLIDDLEKEICICENLGEREWLKEELLKYISMPLRIPLHDMIRRLSFIVNKFTGEEQAASRQYFRQQLSHLTNASALYNRAFHKPLGYAGDYVMMDILCRQPYAGGNLWEAIANYLLTSIPPGEVVLQRSEFIRKKIFQKAEERGGLSVLNLACGSCEEVCNYIARGGSASVQFYLVDQEPRALEFAARRCLHANIGRKDKVKTYFINNTVKQFLKDKDAVGRYPQMDLIYSSGLFDYLPDPAAMKLMSVLYGLLGPRGTLLIGNYNLENDFRFMMDYATDWELLYRTEAEMRRLVSHLPQNEFSFHVERINPEDANLFLVLAKKR